MLSISKYLQESIIGNPEDIHAYSQFLKWREERNKKKREKEETAADINYAKKKQKEKKTSYWRKPLQYKNFRGT